MLRNFSWVLPGLLAGAAQPGGVLGAGQAALADLGELRELGVRCLVSLTRSAEGLGPLCERAGLQWLLHPIPDYGIPDDEEAFDGLVAGLAARLRDGQPVCAHCYAGVGRTGLVLCCLVGRHLRLPAAQAVRLVRRARPALETAEQVRFVYRYLGGSGGAGRSAP